MSNRHRREWCAALAVLCYPTDPPKAARAITAYLPMLASLPDAAFSPASAEAVASSGRKMAIPAYDEVQRPLTQFWRDNQPRHAAIDRDKPAGWEDRDTVWLDYWHRRQSSGFAPCLGLERPPGGLSWREHVASVVRTHSPRAWTVISSG